MFRKVIQNNGVSTFVNVNDGDAVAGFPYRNGSAWEFAFGNEIQSDDTLYYQDCEYAFIDIDPVENKTMSDIVFRYSNGQIIRYAKSKIVTVDDSAKWRYWFSVYLLKNNEFDDILINMNSDNPYQYMESSLEYGYMEESVVYATIHYYDTRVCTPSNLELQEMTGLVRMRNQSLNLVEIIPITVVDDVISVKKLSVYEQPVYIDISYKVSNKDLTLNIPSGVDSMRKAVAAKVAANIDHNWCNCHLDQDSFILKMQEELPTVVQTPLGGALTNFEFGSRYGDRLYSHFLQDLIRGSTVYVK
jgi:hypothetical protein